MKIKKPIAYGLIGALSLLGGCKEEKPKQDFNEKKPTQEEAKETEEKPGLVYKETSNGFSVKGKINNVEVGYRVYLSDIYLDLEKDGIEITLTDYSHDGNIDGIGITQPIRGYRNDLVRDHFSYRDNGKVLKSFLPEGYTEEDAQRLLGWANEKLKKVEDILAEEFGDKVKFPEGTEKSTIDEIIDEFDF